MTELWEQAVDFIYTSYQEMGRSKAEADDRAEEVKNQVEREGTYTHTYDELVIGSRMAWRNSNRCIGRLFWDKLHVFDKREAASPDEIKEALFHHISYATNNGSVLPAITIFKQETGPKDKIRIWNHQLIRYAGYETDQGIIGDPDSVVLTKKCISFGWKPKFNAFDVLPLLIEVDGGQPAIFDIPQELIKEVHMEHPEFSWFKDLRLKWYGVPFISSMKLEIGGINYTAAPFNGWYMGTEIGARNFADADRYNLLPLIGKKMGLDIARDSTLWKDRALIELNEAVLFSFKKERVSIVDHHTAAKQFRKFEENEEKCGRDITGNWGWLIPPISPAATHIFHKPYKNEIKSPNFFYQSAPY
ncbi:nitric oxide synthase oxygenase [Bacillus massiliglaciei]|uniref:nitric oxide synthase oxygenase n=1 Tax=Bacillus massiliglaciei TaxID=1816693 RepID=UPI000B24DDD0|nr:nitric oxide synthase oxygenase [Bacillus massiliglaciei]